MDPYSHLLKCSMIVSGHLSNTDSNEQGFISALDQLKNWPKHEDNRFSMDIKLRPLIFSCHDAEQLFLYQICNASDLLYLSTRYNYEIFRCDEMSRKTSIKNRFVRCVEKFLPRCANHEDNYDPYSVFMKKMMKNTTTIKEVVELSQAHSHYPQRLFKYAIKKIVVDRKKNYIGIDPWDSFFYNAYRPKKPSRYNRSQYIDIERVTDSVPENEGKLVVQQQQSLPTKTNQKYSTPENSKVEMIVEETTSDNGRHQQSFHNSQTFTDDSRKRVLLEVDRRGMRLVHHRFSVAKGCAECELAREQISRRIRRARSEFPRRDLSRIPHTVDGNITLPRAFYLPIIPKNFHPSFCSC